MLRRLTRHLALHGLKKVKAVKLIKHFGKIGYLVIKAIYPQLLMTRFIQYSNGITGLLLRKPPKYAKQITGADKALKQLDKEGYKLSLLTNCSRTAR